MSSGTPSGASGSLVPPLTTTPTIDSPHSCVRPRSGVRPALPSCRRHRTSLTRHQSVTGKMILARNPVALLVGDLPTGEDLDVGDQLPHRSACLTGVAAELSFELDATPIAQRAIAKLEVRPLHLGAPIEQPVDLGE